MFAILLLPLSSRLFQTCFLRPRGINLGWWFDWCDPEISNIFQLFPLKDVRVRIWSVIGRKRGRVGWRCVLQEDVAHLPMELTNPWVLRNLLNYEPNIQNICKWEYSWQRAFNLKLQKMRDHFIYCENLTKVECCFRRIVIIIVITIMFANFLINVLGLFGAVKYIVLCCIVCRYADYKVCYIKSVVT